MLKLASLSLVAALALTSPVAASAGKKCIPPAKFEGAIKVTGNDLASLKKISSGMPDEVDLVLLLKDAPVAVAFIKGCAVGVGSILPPEPKVPQGEKL